MTKIAYRQIQSFMLLMTLMVFLGSLYLQYFVGVQPCPLCLMQRLCVFLLLVLMSFRLGTLRKAHVISFIKLVISLAGLFFALRHLYLISLPAGHAPACLPGLDILMHYFPWQTIAKALFWGSGECSETPWVFYGISLPGYAAMYFVIMTVLNLYLFVRTRTLN